MNLRRLHPARSLLLAVAVACTFAGCGRSAYLRSHVDMLNTEQRLLEDDFYELQNNYKYAIDDARRLHDENQTLRKRLGLAPTDPIVTTPAETVPAGDNAVEEPLIDLGTPQAPRQLPNPPMAIPNGNLPGGAFPAPRDQGPQGKDGTDSDDSEEGAAYVAPDDMRVTHIVINPVLSAGHDFDRRPGDDGVSVVIEPRNADDVFVPRAGNVSIVALDPAQEGDAQRVARWDFDIDETLLRLRTGRFGRGLNFKLPWNESRPEHSKLHLFVRYISDDGRVLEDNREIAVTLEGHFSNRWTPKSVQPAADQNKPDANASQQILIGSGSRNEPDSARSVLVNPEPLPAPAGSQSPPEEISPPGRPVWQPFRSK